MYPFSSWALVLVMVGCETPKMRAISLSLLLEFLNISFNSLRSFCSFMEDSIRGDPLKSLMNSKQQGEVCGCEQNCLGDCEKCNFINWNIRA